MNHNSLPPSSPNFSPGPDQIAPARALAWPNPHEYNEAIQNPSICFSDSELKNGHPELSPLGLPIPISGNFASVYKVNCEKKSYAIRCFLHEGEQQVERYEAISKYFLQQGFKFAVPFEFIREGIKIGAHWYPILKMDWVDGLTVDRFVRMEANNPGKLLWLAEELRQLVDDMQARKIAHGDLQHANLIVNEDRLLLVDYDCVFVPHLNGMHSPELGHRNYQHPKRSRNDFSADLDNFSIWVMYVSLRILAADPGLVRCAEEDFESLLFTREDFLNPHASKLFHLLEQHRSKEVVRNARLLRAVLKQPYPDIPRLSERQVIDRCVKTLRPLKLPAQGPNVLDQFISIAKQAHSLRTAKDPNEELRFWYPYLLNKYKSKLRINEFLLAASVICMLPVGMLGLPAFVVSISFFVAWIISCFSLKDSSDDFQRAAYVLAESSGIPVSYELKMGNSPLGFPEVFVLFQNGEVPSEILNKKWSISNWYVTADPERKQLNTGKNIYPANGELYLDPKSKKPIAIFSGNLLLWMI